jgi:hypothetical protein
VAEPAQVENPEQVEEPIQVDEPAQVVQVLHVTQVVQVVQVTQVTTVTPLYAINMFSEVSRGTRTGTMLFGSLCFFKSVFGKFVTGRAADSNRFPWCGHMRSHWSLRDL